MQDPIASYRNQEYYHKTLFPTCRSIAGQGVMRPVQRLHSQRSGDNHLARLPEESQPIYTVRYQPSTYIEDELNSCKNKDELICVYDNLANSNIKAKSSFTTRPAVNRSMFPCIIHVNINFSKLHTLMCTNSSKNVRHSTRKFVLNYIQITHYIFQSKDCKIHTIICHSRIRVAYSMVPD